MGCAASGAADFLAEDPNSNSNPRAPNGSSSSDSRPKARCQIPVPWRCLKKFKQSGRTGPGRAGQNVVDSETKENTEQDEPVAELSRAEFFIEDLDLRGPTELVDRMWSVWGNEMVRSRTSSEWRSLRSKSSKSMSSEDVQLDEPIDHDEHGNEISPNAHQRRINNSAFSSACSAELEGDQREPGSGSGCDTRREQSGGSDLRELSTDRVSAGPLPPPLSEPARRPVVLNEPGAKIRSSELQLERQDASLSEHEVGRSMNIVSASDESKQVGDGQQKSGEVSPTTTTKKNVRFNSRPTFRETIADASLTLEGDPARSFGSIERCSNLKERTAGVSSDSNEYVRCFSEETVERRSLSEETVSRSMDSNLQTPLASIIDDAWDLQAAPTPSCEERVSLSRIPPASDDILDEIGVVSGGCDQYLPFVESVAEAEGASNELAPKCGVSASSAPVASAEESLDSVDVVVKKPQDTKQRSQTDNSFVLARRRKTGTSMQVVTEPIPANTKVLPSPRPSIPGNLANAMAEDGGTGGCFNLTRAFDARERLASDVDTESSPKMVTSESALSNRLPATASVPAVTSATIGTPTTESSRAVSDESVAISTQDASTRSSLKDRGGGMDANLAARISHLSPVHSNQKDLQVDGPSSKEGCPATVASGTNEKSYSAELSKEDAQVIANEQVSLPGSSPSETAETGQPSEELDVCQAPFENSTGKSCRQGPVEELPSQDEEIPSPTVSKTDPTSSLERRPPVTLSPNTNPQVGKRRSKMSRSATAQAIRSASRWGFVRECGEHSMGASVTTLTAPSLGQYGDNASEDKNVVTQVETDVPVTNLDTVGIARSPYYLSEDARLSPALRPTELASKFGRRSERNDRAERSGLHWPHISRGTRHRHAGELIGGHSAPQFKKLFRWACRGISTEWGGDLPSATPTASVASPGASSGSGISVRIGNLSSQSTPFVPDSVSEESFKQVISPADGGFEPAPQDAEAFSPRSVGNLELLAKVLTAAVNFAPESSTVLNAKDSNVCMEANGESERFEINVETPASEPNPIIPPRRTSRDIPGESALPRMQHVAVAPLPAEILEFLFEDLRRKTAPKPPMAWSPPETLEAHPPNDTDSEVSGAEIEVGDGVFAATGAGVPQRSDCSTDFLDWFRTSKAVSEASSQSSCSQQGQCEAVADIVVEKIVSLPSPKSFDDGGLVNSISDASLAHQPTDFPGATLPNHKGPQATAVPKVPMNPSAPCCREACVHPSPNGHAKTQARMPATMTATGSFPPGHTPTGTSTSRSSSKSQFSSDSSIPPVIRVKLYEHERLKPETRGIKPSARDAEVLRFNLNRKGTHRQTRHYSNKAGTHQMYPR